MNRLKIQRFDLLTNPETKRSKAIIFEGRRNQNNQRKAKPKPQKKKSPEPKIQIPEEMAKKRSHKKHSQRMWQENESAQYKKTVGRKDSYSFSSGCESMKLLETPELKGGLGEAPSSQYLSIIIITSRLSLSLFWKPIKSRPSKANAHLLQL